MILLDKICLGNEKVATVRKHILQQFESVFEEPSVYDITRFNVQDAPKTYRTVDDNWIIVLRTDTQVVKVADLDDTIPRSKFGFADDSALISRLYQVDKLTDLGGILRAITSEFPVTTTSGTRTMKRELHVETDVCCFVDIPYDVPFYSYQYHEHKK